jgi:thymidylate synthase
LKLLIIYSDKSGKLPKNEFEIKTDNRFANTKFIPHLNDSKEVCTVCGDKYFGAEENMIYISVKIYRR